MNKEKQPKLFNKSTRKAIFFIFIVAALIIVAMLFRLAALIKESSYNSKDLFNLSVEVNDQKAMIFSFNPKEETINVITLTGNRDKILPGKILAVFIDGSIIFDKNNKANNETATEILFYTLIRPGIKKINLNSYDLVKLYFYSLLLPNKNYQEDELKVKTDPNEQDKIIQKLFLDNKIIEEQKSIEIINGTNIEGLGKRLERIIKNSGGNVIAVSSSLDEIASSNIISEGDSYTVKKLSKHLKYKITKAANQQIADIKIIIGNDGISNNIL